MKWKATKACPGLCNARAQPSGGVRRPRSIKVCPVCFNQSDSNSPACELFLDGVYVTTGKRLTFRRVPSPSVAAIENLVHLICKHVGRALERQGRLVRDFENSFLTVDRSDGAGFEDLLGHSITYRIALGPHQGRKAFTVQTVPAVAAADDNSSLANAAGLLQASCPSPCGPACGRLDRAHHRATRQAVAAWCRAASLRR